MSNLYHKIETLFEFDKETKRFNTGKFYNKSVELLKENNWLFTEKIDGTNFRIIWDGHRLTYGGRTENSTFSKEQIEYIEKNLVNEIKETLIESMFMERQIIIYGELYGTKIQNGRLYTDGLGISFKVFDIKVGELFLTYDNMKDLANKLEYDFVPLVLVGTINDGINFVKKTELSTFSKAKLEGLVGKPVGDFRDRNGKRIVVKIKKRDIEKEKE